ncbi:hypothetical protein ACLB2K_035201 [Fragaria x ananassa]
MASTNFARCFFLGILCISLLLLSSGRPTADVIPADVIPGEELLNVGPCSKFDDCNKYCLENYNHELGGFCEQISPGGEEFCLCKV